MSRGIELANLRSRGAVYIHVGAPKSGTTFIQELLYGHREALRNEGVLYPVDDRVEHFLQAVDLRSLAFYGERFPAADGTWWRTAGLASRWPGLTILSHDVFAGASAEEARVAIESLKPAEVHIVYTARDLARQLPSQWQEDVKHGLLMSFDQWLGEVLSPASRSETAVRFWSAHNIVDVLTRWGSRLPEQNVHVVTVPPRDAPHLTLWRRFAAVIGVDYWRYDTAVVGHINKSLGLVEVELLRRVNRHLRGKLSQAKYGPLVKERLAHRILEKRSNAVPILLPRSNFDQVDTISRQLIETVRKRRYHIVGSIEELQPVMYDGEDNWQPPGDVSDREVADIAAEVIAQLLVEPDVAL